MTCKGKVTEKKEGKVSEDAPCVWRGKSTDGEWLHCTNLRQRHPTLKTTTTSSSDGEEGGGVPVILKYCAYHTPTCVGEHDEDANPPPVKSPNMHGLCTQCIMNKKDIDKSIPSFTFLTAPGVCPVNLMVAAAKAASIQATVAADKEEDELQEGKICGWKPSKKESLTNVKDYMCKNVIYKNPESKALIPFCAMHGKQTNKQTNKQNKQIYKHINKQINI